MTLEEASKIQSSLMELSVDVEDFSWGPSYELAMERRKEALDIIYEEVNRLSKARSFNDYCDFRTTKLFNIITLIGFLIDHNPKDHLNKQIMLKNEIRQYYDGADNYDKLELQYMYGLNFNFGNKKELKELLEFFNNLACCNSLNIKGSE